MLPISETPSARERGDEHRHAGADVGALDALAVKPARTADDRPVGIAERDPSAHRDELVDEEQAVLEHLLEDQDRRRRPGSRGPARSRSGRPGRPARARRRSSGSRRRRRRGSRSCCSGGTSMSSPSIVDCSPSRRNWRRIIDQVAGLDVADPQLAAGRGGERHEAADLDVVGADRVLGAAEPVAAVDGHHVRADPVDLRRPSSSAAARGPGRAARRRRWRSSSARASAPRPSARSRSPSPTARP